MASLWSRLVDAWRDKNTDGNGGGDGGGSSFSGDWGEWGMSEAGAPVNSWSALHHGPVMAAVSILAEDLAKIPVGVFRRTKDGGKEPAKDHALHRLLRRPNTWQTTFEWKEMMQAALVLRGNAYSVILRNKRGEPLQLIPVHPDRVNLWESPDGQWFYMVTRNGLHEMAMLRNVPSLVPAEDMLHLRWLQVWHSLMGSSRIALGREPIGLGMSLAEHHSRFAGQGTRLSGFLSTDKSIPRETRDQIASDWQKAKAGPRNAGGTAVLEYGMKWEQLGMSMVDAEFMASREFQLREVARVFGIPPYKLGILGADSGPSLVQQGQEYLNGPMSGYCERWTAKLEQVFEVDGEDTFVAWDYAHFLKADIQTRFTAYRQAVGAPWMAVNEARRGEGLPDQEHGDEVLQPTNLAPLGWEPPEKPAGGTSGSDQTGSPGQGGDGDAERLPGEEPAPSN
jgi:HK97 family phage portal protein